MVEEKAPDVSTVTVLDKGTSEAALGKARSKTKLKTGDLGEALDPKASPFVCLRTTQKSHSLR